MAGYTELVVNCDLKHDTPQGVILSLKCLLGQVGNSNQNCVEGQDLPFNLLKDNMRFSVDSESTLTYEQDTATYYLSIHADIKDYYGWIDRFLSWLAPYSNREGFVGYKYHYDTGKLALIFCDYNKAFLAEAISSGKTEITGSSHS